MKTGKRQWQHKQAYVEKCIHCFTLSAQPKSISWDRVKQGNVLLPCLIFCLFCAAKKRVNQRPFGGAVTRQIAVMLADFNFIEQNLCSVLMPNQTLRCPEKNNTALPAWMTVSALLLHMSRKPGARLSPAPPRPVPHPTYKRQRSNITKCYALILNF